MPPGLPPNSLDQRSVLIHSPMSTRARSEVMPILPPDNTEAFQGQRGNVIPQQVLGLSWTNLKRLPLDGAASHRKWEVPQPTPAEHPPCCVTSQLLRQM